MQKIVKGAKILGAEHRLNSLQTVSTLETVANSDSIEKTFNKVKIKSKSNSNSSLSKVNWELILIILILSIFNLYNNFAF